MWWRGYCALVVFVILCLPETGFGQENGDGRYGGRLKSRAQRRQTRQKQRISGGYGGGYEDVKPSGGYDYKPTTTTRGYVYTPPTTTRGYVYTPPPTTTTTTTTPPPGFESAVDIDSSGIRPSPPAPVEIDKGFEMSPEVNEHDEWDIRDSVPGSPGDDYPVLGHIPRTPFTCEGRIPGYYADPMTRCQVFHRCSDCTDNVRLQMDSFLCPNGTQFNQEILSCDWWANVHCEDAERYYSLNKEIGVRGGDGEYVKFSGTRRAPAINEKKVAPIIIPKELRSPLPAIYRSNHVQDDSSSHGGLTSSSGTKARPPAPPKKSELFNEFSKPREPAANDGISNALNNPDYFTPADLDPRQTESGTPAPDPKPNEIPVGAAPADPSTSNDEEYFDEIQESRADEVSAFPAAAIPTTTTSVKSQAAITTPATSVTSPVAITTLATSAATTTAAAAPARPYESEDGSSVQVIIPLQTEKSSNSRFLKQGEKASGFIVNRFQQNVLDDEELKGAETLGDIQREIQPPSPGPDNLYVSSTNDNSPSNAYIPPEKTYLPPSTSTEAAASPARAPEPSYLPPKAPEPSYLPPKAPEPTYLPPNDDSQGEYFLAPKPSGGYSSPAEPQPSYGAPKNDYLPPKDEYLPPKNDYLPPKNEYLPPSAEPSPEYLPPKIDYLPPKNDYLPPKNEYLPPQNNYLPPQNSYLPPQQYFSSGYEPSSQNQFSPAPIQSIPFIHSAPFLFTQHANSDNFKHIPFEFFPAPLTSYNQITTYPTAISPNINLQAPQATFYGGF